MHSNENNLTATWKEHAKRAAYRRRNSDMARQPESSCDAQFGVRQGTVAETCYPDGACGLARSLRDASRCVNCGNHYR